MSNQHYAHILHHSFRHAKDLKPVGPGKNPTTAFCMGFAFGPFGVGLYLRSWIDFLITFALVVAGAAMTAGLGAPVFWVMCGAWAAMRVSQSK